ncbi:tetratricopeptide repeat protein [Thalassococcus sp. BH17M4-6]|uniref:tetratricopeptide repeat protein n=1 Tax=Thalassococcus sp. BH17M4-6 TaxID=3413148 RepID=UPI003BCA9302
MSDTDSFIDEVSEEVRRDRLFRLMRRYGWIAVLAVLVLVAGAAWREYRIAQDRSASQAFGDAILAALEQTDSADRVTALQAIDPPKPESAVVLDMLIAAEQASEDAGDAAAQTLQDVATSGEVPEIYRQIASFKALVQAQDSMDADERRIGFEALTTPGNPLRLLAEEQLALIEIETGAPDAALTRLQAILADSEVTAGLRRRASQLIVALGGSLGAA